MDTELDIDQQIEELFQKYDDLQKRCFYGSAVRVVQEASRLAKTHKRLIPYLQAKFHVMNDENHQLDPELARDTAIELIALLESEEKARLFQTDFPEDAYAGTVGWMSACAYDNLATHTASMQGYNSEGMHACIAEGIEVCRRTGKLRCITCFREYATDVYLSSDDVHMALHFARMARAQTGTTPDFDRRWVGAKNETLILLLLGQLDEAEAAAQTALALAESYHSPGNARREATILLRSIHLMMGQTPASSGDSATPPRGENHRMDLEDAKLAALVACRAGEHDKAFALLEHWDRWLTERQCLHHWFDVRLRLIASQKLAGNQARVEALAKQLDEKAWKARDWISLRRLSRLLDSAQPVSPLAGIGPPTSGPYAAPSETLAEPAQETEPPSAEAMDEAAVESTPLDETIQRLGERLDKAEPADRPVMLEEILKLSGVSHPADAGRLLQLLLFVGDDPAQAARTWRWAQETAAAFPQQPAVLNLLATLGDFLRALPESPVAEQISRERIEQLYRESLDLDPFNVNSHARAGGFFLGEENLGEAERCLARGFRLDRGNGFLATRLAEVYNRTDRPRDALMVLDTCLREGSGDPEVAWEAALAAFHQEQYESLLTYLDRFEELVPGEPWVNYYRAQGLLEMQKPREALFALHEEDRRHPGKDWALSLLRACAAYLLDPKEGAAGKPAPWRWHLQAALTLPLVSVDYLTKVGLGHLTLRAWKTIVRNLAGNDPERIAFIERALAAGLAPDDLFETFRQRGQEAAGMNFYRCVLRQPLDERWRSSAGCLKGQEDWPEYNALYGVLARSEEEAAKGVLAWQKRCYPLPATVEACELQGENYTDKPGVVWQGDRWYEPVNEATS